MIRHHTVSATAETELLAAVARIERSTTRQFNMSVWARGYNRDYGQYTDVRLVKTMLGMDLNTCGTACCLAGEICAHNHNALKETPIYSGIRDEAVRIAGLHPNQASLLFDLSYWPTQFQEEYGRTGESTGDDNRARRVSALRHRVEHFIQTGN